MLYFVVAKQSFVRRLGLNQPPPPPSPFSQKKYSKINFVKLLCAENNGKIAQVKKKFLSQKNIPMFGRNYFSCVLFLRQNRPWALYTSFFFKNLLYLG